MTRSEQIEAKARELVEFWFDDLPDDPTPRMNGLMDELNNALALSPDDGEAVPVVMECAKTAPERIWLQISDDEEHLNEPFPYGSEVTWCQDSVTGAQVEYVRADLASPPSPADAEPVARVYHHSINGAPVTSVEWLDYEGAQAIPSGQLLYASPPSPDRTQGHTQRMPIPKVIGSYATPMGVYVNLEALMEHLTPIENEYSQHAIGFTETMRQLRALESPVAAHVAAQADALAALKQLCDVQSAPYQELGGAEFNACIQRLETAWAEARRVIAATGEKHE